MLMRLSLPQKYNVCNTLEQTMLQLLESTLCNIFSFQEIPVKMYIKVPAHGISNALISFFPITFSLFIFTHFYFLTPH